MLNNSRDIQSRVAGVIIVSGIIEINVKLIIEISLKSHTIPDLVASSILGGLFLDVPFLTAFITELRNSTSDAQILGAAAVAQKHSVAMQESDTYDLATHVRATKAAMEWCDNYATNTTPHLALEVNPEGADGESAAKRRKV